MVHTFEKVWARFMRSTFVPPPKPSCQSYSKISQDAPVALNSSSARASKTPSPNARLSTQRTPLRRQTLLLPVVGPVYTLNSSTPISALLMMLQPLATDWVEPTIARKITVCPPPAMSARRNPIIRPPAFFLKTPYIELNSVSSFKVWTEDILLTWGF